MPCWVFSRYIGAARHHSFKRAKVSDSSSLVRNEKKAAFLHPVTSLNSNRNVLRLKARGWAAGTAGDP
eukprot:3432945-Prorocentrum_lima.AAC.1